MAHDAQSWFSSASSPQGLAILTGKQSTALKPTLCQCTCAFFFGLGWRVSKKERKREGVRERGTPRPMEDDCCGIISNGTFTQNSASSHDVYYGVSAGFQTNISCICHVVLLGSPSTHLIALCAPLSFFLSMEGNILLMAVLCCGGWCEWV